MSLGLFGHLFRIVGVAQWGLAAFLGVLLIREQMSPSQNQAGSTLANFWHQNDISAFSQTIPAVVFLLLFGFLCLGLGQLFLCIKDMSKQRGYML